jgi:SAM-dependent methyltransferase
MDNSLERIIPDLTGNDITDQETLRLHLERYHFAGRHLIPGTIADIACGTGYGSYLLATEYSDHISGIYAVDRESQCIEYANKKYPHALITYFNTDACQFQPPGLINNVISLETIEHLNDPAGFIGLMAKHLATKGRFIASIPVTPSMDANPYHLHDFSITTFNELFIQAGFRELDSFVQKQSYDPFSIVYRRSQRTQEIRRDLLAFYCKYPRKFFLRLRSLLYDGFNNKYLVIVFEKI